MSPRRTRAVVIAGLLLVLSAPPAVAQEGESHLILEVLETDQDKLYGYLVYHEEAKTEYRLLILPEAGEAWRCDLTGLDRVTVVERTRTYEGRDGKPCRYAMFVPDAEPPPPGRTPVPTGGPSRPCPTCPG